ncbi:helix-turn-helix transcriptional regulator [Sphingomonas sp. RS2018]
MADLIRGVVDRFRDAALGLAEWDEALAAVGAATNATMIQLTGIADGGQLLINRTRGISTDQMAAYFDARGFDPLFNPRTRGILDYTPMRCFTDDDLLQGTTRSTFAIYDDLFHPTDAHHSAQIRLNTTDGVGLGLTLMRSRTPGTYDRRTRDLVERLGPGIAAACHAALAFGTAQDRTIVQTAELLAGQAILLGADRTIVSLSPAAEQTLRTGRALTVRAGRLVAIDAVSDRDLDRAFRCAESDTGQARVSVRALGGPLHVELTPLPPRLPGTLSVARVLLTMRQPSQGEEALATSAQALGLSGAEGEVAVLLAAGLTLAQIAERRGSAVSTVRTQLKSAFNKTGTHRQTELVMLLRRGA